MSQFKFFAISLISLAFCHQFAVAQTDTPIVVAPAPQKMTTTYLACGGVKFAAFLINAGGTVCSDINGNLYTLTFAGFGVSAVKRIAQASILKIQHKDGVEGSYVGGRVGGIIEYFAAQVGHFYKKSVVDGTAYSGRLSLLAVGFTFEMNPPAPDVEPQVLNIAAFNERLPAQ